MVTNLQGKKVQTHQDDEVKCIFTPMEQSYNNNLKNILLWTIFREERTWVNIVGLVGLFQVEWKTPHHNILIEFLNNWKLDFEHNKIKVLMVKELKIIDKHLLAEVFKIFHKGETKVDQVKMLDAIVALVDIVDRVLNTYNTNERWFVKKMRLQYVNRIIAILPIIYQKNKV